ncbi:MAG: hypothetical protein C5B51_27490 [Terriglobia bacterium]|nr:MAG: hypothetical protein C5B51_27490 [Terriglobia bacterium]
MTEALRARLEQLYWDIESRIDPGVVSSQNTYADTIQMYVGPHSRWLDLGCGRSIFPDWIEGQQELATRPELIAGIDYSWSSLRQHNSIRKLACGDTAHLPFRAGAFNLITANMVFEHLADPAQSLREMNRILEPGGLVIFHTPNLWHFPILAASLIPDAIKRKLVLLSEGRAESDIFPTHYRINTRRDIERFAAAGGFHIKRLDRVSTSSTGDLLLYGPFLVFALLWRRLLRRESLQDLRSNFIVILQKAQQAV